jgi:hypothetical protein
MTIKEFARYKPGRKVQWREGKGSPRAGEVTEIGEVRLEGTRRFVQWPDGQQTDGLDDWALRNVEGYFPIEADPPE